MHGDFPIILTDLSWTKNKIHDQLFDDDNPLFQVEDMLDEDVFWWAREEAGLKYNFPSEEDYVDQVDDLNKILITRTLKRVVG